jgi:hypothetical protein
MNRDDIIRGFLMLHPDTPIDMKEYAVPLLIIKQMLETCIDYERKAEREECAKVAESYEPRCDTCPSGAANAIRARGQQ